MLLDSCSPDDTPALIIDLDHGEIKKEADNDDQSKDEGENSKKPRSVVCFGIFLCWAWLTTYQGTPIFMARSVVACHPLIHDPSVLLGDGRYFGFWDLPHLLPSALEVYSKVLPGRLRNFPSHRNTKRLSSRFLRRSVSMRRAFGRSHGPTSFGMMANLCSGCSCGGPSIFAPDLRCPRR